MMSNLIFHSNPIVSTSLDHLHSFQSPSLLSDFTYYFFIACLSHLLNFIIYIPDRYTEQFAINVQF